MVDPSTELRDAAQIGALWAGLLLAPAAFLLNLELSYVMVRRSCLQGTPLPVHVVQGACLLAAVVGTLIAWRQWLAAGREWPGEAGGAVGRTRFLAGLGLTVSLLFVLVILAQWLPAFTLHPCQ